MTNKEKLTRKVIEALHGKPWEEAFKIEQINEPHPWYGYHPITAARLMQALEFRVFYEYVIGGIRVFNPNTGDIILTWKLLKDNKQDATLDNQTDETIDKLLKIFE